MDIYLPQVLEKDYFLELLSKIEAIRCFNVDMIRNQDLVTIVVNKFGETRLSFKETKQDKDVKYTLVHEDMATFHKPFRSAIIEGLSEALGRVGGRVVL